MGGNAIKKIKEVTPVRLSKPEYDYVCEFAKNAIKFSSDNVQEFGIVRTFEDKPDFGDLDIILKGDRDFNREKFEKDLNQYLNGSKFNVISNGPVSSFVYEINANSHFQVDINYVPLGDSFDAAYAYHGNGDLGNLVGRIFHNLGTKFGHDGLSYIHRNETYVVGDILLSDNVEDIFSSIGLNYDRDRVFNSEREIFDFIISSPFFHPNFYQLELRNHTARVRDKKRPSYTRFVEYINSKTFREKPLASKSYYTVLIEQFGATDRYLKLVAKESERLYNKAMCDATFVKEVSGLDGKELGELMQSIKSRCEFCKFEHFHVNREHLKKFILGWKIVHGV